MIVDPRGLVRVLRSRVKSSRFVRDAGALTVANVLCALISFVQGILVARWLGPELYGIATLAMASPNVIYTFFDARSTPASVKYLGEFHGRGEKERAVGMCKVGYVVDLSVAILAFIVILVSSTWAAEKVVHQAEIAWLIGAYGVAFLPRALTGTSFAVLSALGRFSSLAWINAGTEVLRAALVLSLVLLDWQVTGVILGNAIATGTSGLVSGIVAYGVIVKVWGESPFRGSWPALQGYRAEIAKFLAFSDMSALFGMIPKQLDVLILGYMRGPADAGYYRLAKTVATTANLVVAPLQAVALPKLVRMWSRGESATGAIRRDVSQMALLVGLPLASLIAAGALVVRPILEVVVGEAYVPAAIAGQLLLAAAGVWAFFFWLRPLYLATGRAGAWAIGIGIHALCFGVLAVPAVKLGSYLTLAALHALLDTIFHVGMTARARRIVGY